MEYKFTKLETERLILRKMIFEDTESILLIYGDNEVAKHEDMSPLKTLEEAKSMIQSFSERLDRLKGIFWGIVRKKDDILIGTCGYHCWFNPPHLRGRIGYDLWRECWGQGLMTEALRVVITYGFKKMGLNRIEALVGSKNYRSINLLNKLGFQQEGILREHCYWNGDFQDEICFSLLKREWKDINRLMLYKI